MSASGIEYDVRSYIVDNFLFGEDNLDFSNQDSLLGEGIIDSTGILELVVFLEEKYGLSIEDDELTADNLDSIEKVSVFICRKKS